MAFNELLSSSFLFSIAIIIILIGGVFAYASYRMSEQDHKITSMLGLISTMAEELQFFRSNLNKSEFTKQNLDPEEHTRTHIILDPNNFVAGQPTLISVSDDEDDGDETDDDLEDENMSEDDGDVSDDDLEDDDIIDLENLEEKCNIKSIHLEEPINLDLDHSDKLLLDHSDELLTLDLQSIAISDLEETDKKPDYKKWSLTKLKEVIVEKSIVADASKLKKNEILKLLGVE